MRLTWSTQVWTVTGTGGRMKQETGLTIAYPIVTVVAGIEKFVFGTSSRNVDGIFILRNKKRNALVGGFYSWFRFTRGSLFANRMQLFLLQTN